MLNKYTFYGVIVILIILMIGVYYLSSGCFCSGKTLLFDRNDVVKINYYKDDSIKVITNNDSLARIFDVLNQSVQIQRHEKTNKNVYTSDYYTLTVFERSGNETRLDIRRINVTFYYIYYKKNNNFFKQCLYGNNSLSVLRF